MSGKPAVTLFYASAGCVHKRKRLEKIVIIE